MQPCLKLLTDIIFKLASSQSPEQLTSFTTNHLHSYQCIHHQGNPQTICSRRSCSCSLCLKSPPPSSSPSPLEHGFEDGFEDGSEHHHHRSSNSTSCSRSLKLHSKGCFSCVMSYSADCVAICCCPLSIPIFIFLTLPVLLFKKLSAKLTSRAKEPDPSPYQKLGIDPEKLKKPRPSLLKDQDLPFIGFGDEHWKEFFE